MARFHKGMIPHNKGKRMPAEIYDKVSRTMFQPGQRPATAYPIGKVVLRKDSKGRKYYYQNCQLVHIKLWEEKNGKIPAGKFLVSLDGNTLNTLPENWIAVTRAENMKRNSYHQNYPKDIQLAIQMQGALNRQINKRKNGNNE